MKFYLSRTKGINSLERMELGSMFNESPTNLKKVLDVAIGKVDSRKLEKLEQKLEVALGGPISLQIVDDPIIIRYRLAEQLRNEGVSPGVVQAFEQLFMGIIRRASLEGLIPAPPEGPWTRAWQSVLDMESRVQKTKAPLRTLASWATARGLAPRDIDVDNLSSWARDLLIDKETLFIVNNALSLWLLKSESGMLVNDALHSDRLQKKALHGTVQDDRDFR